jgi:hypothetical protein
MRVGIETRMRVVWHAVDEKARRMLIARVLEPREPSMNPRCLTSLCAGLLILPWGLAIAQTVPPKTWLGPLGAQTGPGAGMISEKLDEATREELRKGRRVELRGDPKSNAGSTPGGPDPRVAQAENLRTAGKAAFAKGEYETALKQLQGALGLYEEAIASVAKFEVVPETLGYLGAASLALGYDDDAKDYFQRVLALMPDSSPLDEYPAAAVQLFDKLKAQQGKKKKGSLVVRTTPAGATIRVDGTERGKSPVTVAELPRGEHFVQATGEDGSVGGAKVEVKGGRAENVTVELSTQVGPEPSQPVDPALARDVAVLAADGKLDDKFKHKADEIAELTKAQCVVVGHVAPQGNGFVLLSYVYSPSEKQIAALDELRFRADLASVTVQAGTFARAIEGACEKFPFDKILVGGVVAAARPAPPPPVEPKPEPDFRPLPAAITLENPEPEAEEDDDPWYGKWWVWTIAGTALIGGTAYAGYTLLQEDGGNSTVDARVRW